MQTPSVPEWANCRKLPTNPGKQAGDWNGRPFDGRRRARLLRPYGICPDNVRPEPDTQGKGYLRTDFDSAWASYLPVESVPSVPVTAGIPETALLENEITVGTDSVGGSDI